MITAVNTSENSNATKTQENSNRRITVFPRKYIETENQFQKTPVIIKNYTSQPVLHENANLKKSSIIRLKKSRRNSQKNELRLVKN